MITLSDFQRRLGSGDQSAEVTMTAERALWLPAQTQFGHNIGQTDSHVIFVELKTPATQEHPPGEARLGPTT